MGNEINKEKEGKDGKDSYYMKITLIGGIRLLTKEI